MKITKRQLRRIIREGRMKESRQRRNFILESAAESLLGLPRNPSPHDVYKSVMNWMSTHQDPSADPDAGLVDSVIANVMVKNQIRKDDEHIGSKLNMLRRILDPDKARRQSYRQGIESEMRELDPTGKKQKYGYETPNSLRMGESRMKITKRQLKRIIKEEYSRLKKQGLIKESYFKGKHIDLQDSLLSQAQNQGNAITVGEAYQNDMVMDMGLDIDSTFDILMDMVVGGILMRTHDYQNQYNQAKEMVAFAVHPDYM